MIKKTTQQILTIRQKKFHQQNLPFPYFPRLWVKHNFFGYWEYFYILEKLGVSLVGVFSVTDCLNGFDRSKATLGIHLGVKDQSLPVTFAPKVCHGSA